MPTTSTILQRVPLNRTEIDQSLLNIERKERSNPLPWNGQFSPQFVQVLLDTYAPSGSCVLDPFAGSGTLLLEAASKNLSAFGSDINPAACYLARVYTLANLSLGNRRDACEKFERLLDKHFPRGMPLFGIAPENASARGKRSSLPAIRAAVGQGELSVLLAALLVLCDFFAEGVEVTTLHEAWKRLLTVVESLAEAKCPLKVFNADARALPLRRPKVDLVITSPPYVNVLNYHQHFRKTVEALGWQLLRVARSEIGSNRKHRANRFLTVTQYCLDMAQTFGELTRVCKRSARVIFIVGRESRVRGIPFYNGRLIASVAQAVGLELVMRQERVFTNRFGQSIFEDILHFVPRLPNFEDSLAGARQIAIDSLKEASDSATGEVLSDIKDAISSAATVEPSPLYEKSVAFTRSDEARGEGA